MVEELIELGKSEKNALKSNLKILLIRLLKLKIQHDSFINEIKSLLF
ncbi:DUF29 family protein [Anabaena azotica]